MNWLYLALNLGSIAIPLAFSFDKRISYYKSWKALFPAIGITAIFFLIWDFWFTAIGIWKFNYEYVFGLNLVNVPFEEWMFFVFIPYACVFIHESLKFYFIADPFEKYGKRVAILLSIILLVLAYMNLERLYTSVTFILLSLTLLFNVFSLHARFLGRFFMTYLVTMIPFAVINGILTAMPVLIYNDDQNMGIRVGTIPFEDFFYSMLMLLINITIYENLKHQTRT